MTLLRRLNNLFSSSNNKKDFIYPYADDTELKRDQIWQNLQKGVLLEDKSVLVPWLFHFDELKDFAEQRRERADRTELYLGKRIILGGYEANLELVRWKYRSGDEYIKLVSENLGKDSEGEQRFNQLRKYLDEVMGAPTTVELEKFGASDIGTISWEKGAIALTLTGIEHFEIRYTFYIGIKIANVY